MVPQGLYFVIGLFCMEKYNILFSMEYEKRKALGCGFAKISLLMKAQMTESTPSFSGPLVGKTIALGVSGSIAAYKSADLTSELRKAGADVHVVMTESATQFISALTLGTLSRNPVLTSFWDEEGWQPGHIELADKIDLFLVAPATAQQVGNYANGLAPDLLGAIYLATKAPVMLAPAMNGKMYDHKAVQKNLKTLKGRGVKIIEPVVGELACGYEGIGKLAPLDAIAGQVIGYVG
jgi:phosphopantothenoylcysteine synthetase/decarboxylase